MYEDDSANRLAKKFPFKLCEIKSKSSLFADFLQFLWKSWRRKNCAGPVGPSGLRALPVAAGTNEGGHYFRYFPLVVLLLLSLLPFNQEGIVVGFYFLHGLLSNKNRRIPIKN